MKNRLNPFVKSINGSLLTVLLSAQIHLFDIFPPEIENDYLNPQQNEPSCFTETVIKFSVLQNRIRTNRVYEIVCRETRKVRTCLQIKSCVGHNLLKTIIVLAVVLRVFGNLSLRIK